MTKIINHIEETDKIINDLRYADRVNKKFGLTNFQLEAIRLLSLDNKIPLNDRQKKLVQNFIKQSMGDTPLNKKLKSLSSRNLNGTGLNIIVVGKLVNFTYKTRNRENFDSAFDKINKNHNRIINKMELAEENKINLREYAVLSDFSRVKASFFDSLQERGLLDNDLLKLHEKMNKAEEIIRVMDAGFKKDVAAKPGLMIFDDIKRKFHMQGKASSFFDNLIIKLVTKYAHVSKVYKSKDQVKMSELNPDAQSRNLEFKNCLYADGYRLKLENLISDENKALLQQLYGPGWQAVIEQQYAEIERTIHDNTATKFAGVDAAIGLESIKLGLASLLPKSLGFKKPIKTDFAAIHQKVFNQRYAAGQGPQRHMLCSEFVGMTTIAALVELNNRIKSRSSFVPGSVVPQGEIIAMPISAKENLHMMHPERFLKILMKKDYVEKVEVSPQVKQYFKTT